MPQRVIDAKNIIDVDWVKQSFMMDSSSIDKQDAAYRVFTTANYKFADTSPGGNAAINPPPQFTRYADVRSPGLGPGAGLDNAYHAMGRYYSESIDDNAVHAILRFGLPEFNSLTSFFTNFYNAEAAAMARTGRASGLFFQAGKLIGFVVGIVPHALVFAGNVARYFMGRPPSKYYYLKPAMFPYWNAVTTMVNTIAVNMGIFPPIVGNGAVNHVNDLSADNDASAISAQTLNDFMHQMLPDIFTGGLGGGIDVYSVATKYQRLYQQYRNAGYAAILNNNALDKPNDLGTSGPDAQFTTEILRQTLAKFASSVLSPNSAVFGSLPKYAEAYMGAANQHGWQDSADTTQQNINNTPVAGETPGTAGAPPPAPQAPEPSTNTGGTNSVESIFPPNDGNSPFGGGYWNATFDMLESELTDGGSFVSFRVDGSGTIGESFSNSTKSSEIQSKINSMSSSSAESRFMIADGNLGGGAIGTAVEGVIGAVKDVVAGLATGVGLGGLAVLAGNAFVDIPEEWDSSVANLPHADFTVQLRSPYGNKMSRLLNLYIPLCMLLAGALPLATGKKTYTSPFLCEAYVRGRLSCRLGIIDSISISRGAGNVGWTENGEPLGIDVTFSVKDLSSVMYMPISASFTTLQALGQAAGQALGSAIGGETGAKAGSAIASAVSDGTWDDDNSYTDYMAVLGSLTMVDQVSKYRQWKIRVAQQAAKFNAWKSPGHFASWLNQTWPSRIISGFVPMTQIGQIGA